jgi:hypothetical protein
MLLYYVPFVNMNAYIFNSVVAEIPQTGLLLTIGLLLFIVGTVLRRSLPVPESRNGSLTNNSALSPNVLSSYGASTPIAKNAVASRRHANAV